ncbi:MAG TPA: PQQ-binding-like beta-propeller repeat protein [Candidatus Nitrosotenuis sp.]|nr:PQQ-binding-like beta-propeller repeat protein [Candidatus Nitrosotenuis sp.]
MLTTPPPDDSLPPVTETNMKLLWEIPYEFVGSNIVASPLILGDSLVIMSAGKEIFAVEQMTGKIRWKYFVDNGTNIQTDGFAADDEHLYMTHIEDVRAINISNGTLVWLTPMPNERGAFWYHSILLNGDKLYVPSDISLYCLSSSSGNIIWQKTFYPERGLLGNPVFFDNEIIISRDHGFDDSSGTIAGVIGELYTLDELNGDSIRSIRIKGDGGFNKIVIDNGIVYGGTHFPYSSASFEAFDAATGERKWSYYTPNQAWDYNDCVIAGDKVIANTAPYWVSAFNKNTGVLLWRKFIIENADSWKVYFYDGFIYHPHAGALYILNPENGEIVHTLRPEGRQIRTIAVGNGKVFVCGHPTLQCYETYKPERK